MYAQRFLYTIVFMIVFLNPVCNADGQTVNDGYGDYMFVPAGEFEMGDNFNEGQSDELPVHTVYLDAYYIGKYQVTNEEYKKFIDDDGYTTEAYWLSVGWTAKQLNGWTQPEHWIDSSFAGGGLPGNEIYPVVGVSWYEAHAYCAWLTTKTDTTYRLPTEAEWEKAARGTDQRRYPWGNDIDGSYANYKDSDELFRNLTPVGYFDGTTHGSYTTQSNASPYGAYDMAGNVREWCRNETEKGRCIRGGAWNDVHYMYGTITQADPFDRSEKNGIRCVIYPEKEKIPEKYFASITTGKARDFYKETPVSDPVFDIYKDYTYLKKSREMIFLELDKEEKKFNSTLEKGLKIFERFTKGKQEIEPKKSFLLYQSYGFPVEMIEEE